MVLYYQSLTAAPGNKRAPEKSATYSSPDDWKEEHSRSFQHLKAALMKSVVLTHPDFYRPFILSTDAPMDGLGVVLSQVAKVESPANWFRQQSSGKISCSPIFWL